MDNLVEMAAEYLPRAAESLERLGRVGMAFLCVFIVMALLRLLVGLMGARKCDFVDAGREGDKSVWRCSRCGEVHKLRRDVLLFGIKEALVEATGKCKCTGCGAVFTGVMICRVRRD